MDQPGLEQARELAQDYKTIPVCRTLFADVRTPIEVLRIMKKVSRHCFLLESLEDTTRWGRYTFLGYDPQLAVIGHDQEMRVMSGSRVILKTRNPGQTIRDILDDSRGPALPGLPPFTGGLVGYFAYDYIKYQEPTLNLDADDQEHFNDVDLMLFDKVIAFDHLKQQIMLIVNIRTDSLSENHQRAALELDQMEQLVRKGTPADNTPLQLDSDFQLLFDQPAYCQMVEQARQLIHEGDIFQVVLSNRYAAAARGSLLDTYRVLRTTNPSPYMFYFSGDDIEIAGASPETLVKLQDGRLYTYPLAGTRPRGRTDEEDAQFAEALLSDPKELAEHNMLVDLGRNDLGRISRFGSVKVEKYRTIERFSHVMHIGSTVSGIIQAGKTALDAIDAVLPAGTLSGAPKVRACEIINQLENNKRGIYGGAIGYIGYSGNMDTCIAIRIAFKKNGKVFVRSGAGIVADSVPENEHQECLNKAKAVLNALKQAEGGLD